MAASKKIDDQERTIKKYLDRILEFYSYYAIKHPLLVKSISSALSSGLGNIVSQKIVKRGKGRRLEYRSVVAFTSFGFCVTGPLLHFFYEYLDKLVPRKLPYSKYKRLAVDRALFSPILLLVFFYTVTILEGKSHSDAVAIIRQNYWTALNMSWRVWIIFQFFNINYVPIQYRVLCGNIMAFLWSIYLATKRSQ